MKKLKETILEAYHFRHACKIFDTDKLISNEDFNFILETGRLSPSSFGFEPWKFVILQNMDLREKIKPICWGAQNQLSTASHFIIILSRKMDLKYDASYIENFMRQIQKLPEDVIALKKDFYKKFQLHDFNLLENDRTLFDWGCKQTYIALGNMMSAAAQIGIDSCPIEGFDREGVEDILEKEGLLDKKTFGISCMVAFGYRKENPHEKTRQSLEDIVEWI